MYSKTEVIVMIEAAVAELNAATERKAQTAARLRDAKTEINQIELISWHTLKGTDKTRRSDILRSEMGADYGDALRRRDESEVMADNAARHATQQRDQFTATLAIAKLVE